MKNPHFVRIQKILGPLVRFLFPITLEGAENLPDDRPVMLCANQGQPLILRASRGAAVAYLNIAKRLLGQKAPLMKIR